VSARNQHLEWVEITDFAPGLWTKNTTMAATPSAAAIMEDCQPALAGGLRATHKAAATPPTTGIPSSSTVLHYFTIPGPLGVDRYLWVYDHSADAIKMLRMDSGAGESSWTTRKTHATGGGANVSVIAETFVDAAGVIYVVYSLASPTADVGVWSYRRDTHAVTKQLSALVQLLTVRDDRIITVVPSAGTAFGNTLRWTDSQSVSSWPAANNLPINISRTNSGVQLMHPYQPSDLLLGFGDTPWVNVQGDITAPIVRSMSDARRPSGSQKGVITAEGLAFSSADGIHLTNNGANFTDLSLQIQNVDLEGRALAYLENLLIAGGGLCYDFETKSWFTISALDNFRFGFGNRGNRIFNLSTQDGTTVGLLDYFPVEDLRVDAFTWKSVPIHASDGRQVAIREVQVFAEVYDSDATVDVTVGGVTHSIEEDAGKHHLSYRFREARGEMLDVQIESTAGSSSNEAPFIEKVRIGYTTGHLLRP
jgi:hypothetical protein